jgi:hypothetical protein
MWLV